MKVDITNTEELNIILGRLTEDAIAQWGLMKPQHMVEHLVKTIEFSNGTIHLKQKTTDEEAKLAKVAFIYTDAEMAMGLKSSLLGNIPDPYRFSDLEESKTMLRSELNKFHAYFKDDSNRQLVHPRFGGLDYQEWIIFHNKHFTHHFKQFGLL